MPFSLMLKRGKNVVLLSLLQPNGFSLSSTGFNTKWLGLGSKQANDFSTIRLFQAHVCFQPMICVSLFF